MTRLAPTRQLCLCPARVQSIFPRISSLVCCRHANLYLLHHALRSRWLFFLLAVAEPPRQMPSSPSIMLWLASALALLGLAAQSGATPTQRRYAKPVYRSHPDRVDAVKDAFQRSWDGYYKYAFPHDTLHPVSNTFEDDR